MKIIIDDTYYIENDEQEFTLMEKKIATKERIYDKDGKFKLVSSDKEKSINVVVGHFISLASALKRVVTLKLAKREDTLTLKEYLKEMRVIADEITSVTE